MRRLFWIAVVTAAFGGWLHSAQTLRAAEGPNLVPNPSLEETQNGTSPTSWSKGRWGTNTVVFRYPVPGVVGSAAEVEMTQRTSGDAKWYFSEVPVVGGATYAFSDQYQSTVPTYVTVQYRHADGSLSWVDLGGPSASAGWTTFEKLFTAPSTATHLTVFHLINAVGVLRVDDFVLQRASDPAKFDEGFLSLNFDDGWKSAYQNAMPILDKEGLRTTQYIITRRFDFPAYVNREETLDLYKRGHEIGAHTRTHRDLRTLSAYEKEKEIGGSRRDLLAMGITPVQSFAYPFGAYDDTTTPIVQQSKYEGARTSDGGLNAKNGNRWLLKRQPVDAGTTIADIKAWIAQAKAERRWLILVFHRVDTSGVSTAITPEFLQQAVNEIKASGIPVRTMSQGLAEMGS